MPVCWDRKEFQWLDDAWTLGTSRIYAKGGPHSFKIQSPCQAQKLSSAPDNRCWPMVIRALNGIFLSSKAEVWSVKNLIVRCHHGPVFSLNILLEGSNMK